MEDFDKLKAQKESIEARQREAVSCKPWLDAETVRAAIEAEPDLSDDMPDKMWDAIRNDRDAATELCRIAVRLTKEGIIKRLGLEASNAKDQ